MARSLICAEMPMAAALDRLFPVQFARLTWRAAAKAAGNGSHQLEGLS
jgi:hypothetical protein